MVGDRGIRRVGHETGRDGGVDPHAALALLEQGQVLVEPVRGGAGRAVIGHQVEVVRDRVLPFLAVELGFPVHVEPAPAIAVVHGTDEGHVLAPARLAAQADAIDLVPLVGHRGGGGLDVVPGRAVGDGDPGLLRQIGAVHHHRGFAVERQRIERAVDRQGIADRRQQVIDIVIRRKVVQRRKPVLLGPDRNLIGADGQHVELTAASGDVGRDLLAQRVLLQRDPVDLNVGVFRVELGHEALHADHVAVVHGGHGDRFREGAGGQAAKSGGAQKRPHRHSHDFLPRV